MSDPLVARAVERLYGDEPPSEAALLRAENEALLKLIGELREELRMRGFPTVVAVIDKQVAAAKQQSNQVPCSK